MTKMFLAFKSDDFSRLNNYNEQFSKCLKNICVGLIIQRTSTNLTNKIIFLLSFHFSFISFISFCNIFHKETFTKKIHIQNIMKIRIHFDNVIQNMIQTYHN